MARGMASLRPRKVAIPQNHHRRPCKRRQGVSITCSITLLCSPSTRRSNAAYEFRILLIHILPSSSPEARSAAIDAIVAALGIPTVFDFDTLYNLDPIIAVRDHGLFSLIQIFLRNGLSEFRAWLDSNPTLLETHRKSFSAFDMTVVLTTRTL